MATKLTKRIDVLWRQFTDAIDAAYKADKGTAVGAALRDYASDVGWHSALDDLVRAEVANERQHRHGWPGTGNVPTISVAAKMLLLHNAADGAALDKMPSTLDWLILRRTAVEATVLGFLIREHVSHDWIAECAALDYSAEMHKEVSA